MSRRSLVFILAYIVSGIVAANHCAAHEQSLLGTIVLLVKPDATRHRGPSADSPIEPGPDFIARGLMVLAEKNGWVKAGMVWMRRADVVPVAEAEAFFSAVVAESPSAFAYASRSAARVATKDYAGALRDGEEAVRLDPRWALAYKTRGDAHQRRREFAESVQDYTRALELDGSLVRAYSARATSLSAMGAFRPAVADIDKALSLLPRSEMLLAQRAHALAMAGDLDGALADFERSLAAKDNALAREGKAFTLTRRAQRRFGENELGRAVADFDEAERTFRFEWKPALHRERAWARLLTGEFAGAAADINELLRRDPSDLLALEQRVTLHYLRGKGADAVTEVEEVIRSRGRDQATLWLLGQAHRAAGDPRAALADYSAALELDRLSPGVLTARGAAHAALRQFDAAVDDFCAALRIDAADIAALGYRAEVFLAQGDSRRAVDDLSAVILAAPEVVDAYHVRAIGLARVGKLDAAIDDLSAAIAETEKSGRVVPMTAAPLTDVRGKLSFPLAAVLRSARAALLEKAGRAREASADRAEAARLRTAWSER